MENTMNKTLIYAEAQIRGDQLTVQPLNHDVPWSLSLYSGQFVGHGNAVWLALKREDDFYFIQVSEDDVEKYELTKAKPATANAAAVRRKYAKVPGQRFVLGAGIWCRRPDLGDVLWVAGHPACRSRIDVALTLLNHRTKDVNRVGQINRVVRRDPDAEEGLPGCFGALTPKGKGSFSAIIRDGEIDTEWQRVSNVPWLVVYDRQTGVWCLEIFATPAADFDEIADALIDACGLYEFDLFADMLIKAQQPRRKRKKRTTTVVDSGDTVPKERQVG
jgi:hypothetical protein